MDKYSTTRFNKAPTLNAKVRTRFDLSHVVSTTFNTGDFVPFLAEEVYPGETWSLKTATLARLETSLHQTMDNAYLEFAYFFVPFRLLWDNFDKFLGANDDPWTQQSSFTLPQLDLSNDLNNPTVLPQSLLNQLGIPAGSYAYADELPICDMFQRGVYQVYNDWYRDENYDTIVAFSKGNGPNSSPTFNGSFFYPESGILKVNRFHDIFSSVLPAPQKGAEVTLPLGLTAPIEITSIANADLYTISNNYAEAKTIDSDGWLNDKRGVAIPAGGSTKVRPEASFGSGTSGYINMNPAAFSGVADLSQATAATINQLRLAIAAQAIAERDARGGTRLKEQIYNIWHVDCPDARLDRAEFLGGKRIPVSMFEVLQTSETGTTVLGTDAGHSKTIDSSDSFIKSFVEYGLIIGFVYVRTSRSYSQGIDKKFFKKDRFDLYDTYLDNIGEIPVYGRELKSVKAVGESTGDSAMFAYLTQPIGYQEAWYHLKEKNNTFRGYFQSGINGTMDSYHYGDSYSSNPTVNAGWLKEGPENVDRTIAVQSEISYQWKINIALELYATRQMHKYSIPNSFGFGSR